MSESAAQSSKAATRPRLAIVSTFDELCGIAAYTKYLVPQLSDYFDVDVMDLDQYLLRSSHPKVRRKGDAHIKEICERLKDFDVVNIQLEHGTLGGNVRDISRRFKLIANSARRLSVTFHTMTMQETFDVSKYLGELATLKWGKAWDRFWRWRADISLTDATCGLLVRLQKKKSIAAIVHTRRDARHMRDVIGIDRVFDHPLSFIPANIVPGLRDMANSSQIQGIRSLPEGAIKIGVFGFLGRYKGFDTVIRALEYLPEQYHLLIFGGVHPNEIKRDQAISPYVKTLLDEAKAQANEISAKDSTLKLLSRIHFMGALGDESFISGMLLSDIVVLPYLEVGQSSSGPASQAIELGCRVLASRTKTFLQLDRYQPGVLELFDIGNYIELASRIQSEPTKDPKNRMLKYTTETNKDIYIRANTI